MGARNGVEGVRLAWGKNGHKKKIGQVWPSAWKSCGSESSREVEASRGLFCLFMSVFLLQDSQ